MSNVTVQEDPTIAEARNHGLPWSLSHDQWLLRAARHGLSCKQMRTVLGRSRTAIEARLAKLGVNVYAFPFTHPYWEVEGATLQQDAALPLEPSEADDDDLLLT